MCLKKSYLNLSILLTGLLIIQSCTMKKHVDTLVTNARIYTIDDINQVAEAMVINQGKVVSTGLTEDLLKIYEPARKLDAEGKTIFPGFIDAHCHFYGLALGLRWIDLVGCSSFEEVVERISLADTIQEDAWITGRGWDQNLWKVKEFPDKNVLDERWPDRPVVLVRIDGHSVLANQEALDRAGITSDHHFSNGEVEIVHGKLTGILSETAADHIRNAIPKPDREATLDLLSEAQELCFSLGLTGVSDAGLDLNTVKLMDSALQDGLLHIHIYAMLEPSEENIEAFVKEGPYLKDRLHICSIKLYADGSLGSRTALLKQPYSDDPSRSGIQVSSEESIRDICKLALEKNYQVNVHCIGDKAVRMVLDVYGEFLEDGNDRRWRIEHAQVVDPADLILFGKYSVIPSVQATHATSDMYWAGDRLGPERIKWAYAYNDLLSQNGWLPNGTDFPIERVNPLLTFFAAVARQDVSGFPAGGFQPENALSREQAIRSMTIWAAKANFDENEYGSLEPGKWADFILLDKDIMEIPINEVPEVKVLQTWSHGERVYTNSEMVKW
ncbi:MAG: amidohydrolase [Bacteroidales bacterium]|nr:amidohydrolase [Bacteroidales bacterium]